jgi:hypothetical protein
VEVGLAPLLAPSLMVDTHSAANDEPVTAWLPTDGVIANSLTARIRRSSNTRDDFEADNATAEDADADEELDGARCAMGGLFAGINGAPAITAIGSAAGVPAWFIVHVAAALDADGAGEKGVEAHSAASRSSSKNSAQLMSRYTRTASASRDRVRSRGNGASSSQSPPPPQQLASLAGFNVLLLTLSPLHAPLTSSSLSESFSPLLAISREAVPTAEAAAAAEANENRTDRDGVTGRSQETPADDARRAIENSDRMAERGVLVDEEAAAELLLELLLEWLGEDILSASTEPVDTCGWRGATDCAAATTMAELEDKENGAAAAPATDAEEQEEAAHSEAETAMDAICGERPLPARAAAALAAAANGVALTGERVGLFHIECADADAEADSGALGDRAFIHSVE